MSSAQKVKHIEEDRLSMISRMSQAVVDIPKSDITEVKSLSAPPVGVKDTLEAVLVLLGSEDTSWKTARQLLGKFGPESLQQQVKELDPESIPEERRQKTLQILNKYSKEEIKNKSKATVAFYEWAKTIAEE